MEVQAAEDRTELADSKGSSDFEHGDFSSDGGDELDASDPEANDQDESDGDRNKGWADAMAKVLGKKVSSNKAGTILVKSKTVEKEKEKDKQKKLEKKKQLDEKRQWEMMCRLKPDVVKDREVERNLQRIATRGVVQLFNAVRTHQGNINDKIKEVGGSERKRSKLMSSVSKRDFIDVLRGKETKGEPDKRREPKKVAGKADKTPEWNILRDDFMMGAAMKDWDKDSDDGGVKAEPDPGPEQEDSESDSDR
ncbi:RRP15-like protein [Mixophyes fleayi]|uniref:RRP15-like protein n=1 Tax=Mixophyes fleayi TaxID=3061075 RepID=UPI003F4D8F2C